MEDQAKTYTGESVASVRNEHACLANCSIPNSDTLDKPSCAHFFESLCFFFTLLLHPAGFCAIFKRFSMGN